MASWHRRSHRYENFTPGSEDAWLRAVEAPPVSDQLQAMITQVQQALPNILALTNQIATVLDNTANATSNLNAAVVEARPALTNFAVLSGQLREPGGLGVWALGTNGEQQVQNALTNANSILANTDTNLEAILIHLSDITSNLNAQVQANTNLLGGISKAVTDADDLVQGLKRHWLLRSAFKTNAPPAKPKNKK
jgi:ABC-type transporter Mla subunit MlaD